VKKIALLTAVAAAVLVYPAVSSAASFHGVVIVKQSKRHALVVASSTGRVRTVHTSRMRIRVGARVSVRARVLHDGTFSATKVSADGRAHKARIRGVVVRRTRGGRLVSAGHSVFAIHSNRNEPRPGDVVDEDVTIGANGELDEDDFDEVGHVEKTEVEGKVVSVSAPTATTPGTLMTKTEDGPTISITVPAGFNLPQDLKAGDRVAAKGKVDGTTFTLVKLEQEDNEDGDDDGGDDHGGDH